MNQLRRLCLALVLAATTSVVVASPASADAPISDSSSRSFDAVNPCTGEAIVVNLSFDLNIHEHKNNTVVKLFTTVEISDGWSGGGQETDVLPDALGEIIINVNLMISDPASDAKYRVREGLRVDLSTGEPDFFRSDISCVRA